MGGFESQSTTLELCLFGQKVRVWAGEDGERHSTGSQGGDGRQSLSLRKKEL